MTIKLKLNHSLIPMTEVYELTSDQINSQGLNVDKLHKIAKDSYLLSSLALVKIMRESAKPPSKTS